MQPQTESRSDPYDELNCSVMVPDRVSSGCEAVAAENRDNVESHRGMEGGQ